MKINNPTKVGIMVTAVVIMLLTLTFKAGDFQLRKKGYTVKVHFKNIDGVGMNAPVMLNGFEVGYVKDIAIAETETDTMMELEVWLEQDAKVRDGSEAYVKNMGFLGEKYVGLTSGDPGGAVLSPGAIIVGQEPADFDKLMGDAQVIAKELKLASSNIRERLDKNKESIDRIIANFDKSMAKMTSITNNFDERLELNKENIDEFMTNMKSVSRNLDQFSYDLKLHPWKLLYRTKEERQKNIDLLKEK